MRLPVIKHIHHFTKENDVDFLHETMELLEHLADSEALKDEEIDVIGEMMSNISGAIEVHKMIEDGANEKDALNNFMKRVMGSID